MKPPHLINWSAGQLVNWSTGQLVNWSIGQLVNPKALSGAFLSLGVL
jgi:hypothetical protein